MVSLILRKDCLQKKIVLKLMNWYGVISLIFHIYKSYSYYYTPSLIFFTKYMRFESTVIYVNKTFGSGVKKLKKVTVSEEWFRIFIIDFLSSTIKCR